MSIAGGVLHNAGQLLAAALIARTPGLAAYLPVLLVSGAAMGAVNGVIALAVIRRFR
ncbi:MAG: Heptaprenyl diphosphate synthase component I [Firmicutes bacterium ADurb.Bin467]|nr:MAG: Heptaprenyl diphosphate synthase component I [Firmicutes bacterium ADurb.Bin467]